jgi:hypothetical protein
MLEAGGADRRLLNYFFLAGALAAGFAADFAGAFAAGAAFLAGALAAGAFAVFEAGAGALAALAGALAAGFLAGALAIASAPVLLSFAVIVFTPDATFAEVLSVLAMKLSLRFGPTAVTPQPPLRALADSSGQSQLLYSRSCAPRGWKHAEAVEKQVVGHLCAHVICWSGSSPAAVAPFHQPPDCATEAGRPSALYGPSPRLIRSDREPVRARSSPRPPLIPY